MICKIRNTEGFADLKRSYSYENLPIQTKMVILSRRPILVAILLYEHFVHLTRFILHPNIPFLSARIACLSVVFWSLAGVIPFASDTVTRWVNF